MPVVIHYKESGCRSLALDARLEAPEHAPGRSGRGAGREAAKPVVLVRRLNGSIERLPAERVELEPVEGVLLGDLLHG